MTITPTLSDAPQVAVNDIGSEEDFLAAIDATIKYFNDGDIVEGTIVKVDRDPAFAGAVLAAYTERVVDASDDVLNQARAADLYALVDLAARRRENPVAERAHARLAAIAASGDLHAEG